MKCKSSTYVVRHYLTTLKYNNISQVCPYKDLGSAKDYIIILLFLMQPSAGDKPDRMQSQEKHNPIYYAQVKTDYESTWQMQQLGLYLSISAEKSKTCTVQEEKASVQSKIQGQSMFKG